MKKECFQPMAAEFTKESVDFYMMAEEEAVTKKTLLLHSCCGPCSTACIERVLPDYKVTIFYFNPNITDKEEYERRKETQIKFLAAYNRSLSKEDQVDFIEGDYNPDMFYRLVEGHEEDREGGPRCTLCFRLRMEATARLAAKEGYFAFGTTLTVSPHKNYPLISSIGNQLAATHSIEFLDADFKKKAGFQRSIEMSKEYELYSQDYCGCQFSKWHD